MQLIPLHLTMMMYAISSIAFNYDDDEDDDKCQTKEYSSA